MMAVLIKSGEEIAKRIFDGITYRIKAKSGNLIVIKSELEPGAETDEYEHEGEEVRILLEGNVECRVGNIHYAMSPGDVIWHPSSIPHKMRNTGNTKAVYITIGTPPTFM
jgi:quercetin dioxygenase-like cupin family protein